MMTIKRGEHKFLYITIFLYLVFICGCNRIVEKENGNITQPITNNENQKDSFFKEINLIDYIKTEQKSNQEVITEEPKYNIKIIYEGKTIKNYYFSPDKKITLLKKIS